MSELDSKVEAFMRAELEVVLSQCTEKQRAFFHRIYAEGVPKEKLSSAHDLCLRTLRKNEAGRNK